MASIKNTRIISVGIDEEKLEPSTLLVGMQSGAATVENSIEVLPEIKNRNTT